MRAGTILKILGALVILLVVLVGGALVIVKNIDVNPYRGLIAAKAEEATGRKLTLAGAISLELFTLTPSIAIDDVSFANAAWGSRPEMAKFKRLEAQVAFLPLLHKQIQVKRFVLVGPDILLETDANGKGNWEISLAPQAATPAGGEKAAPAGKAPESAAPAPGGTNALASGQITVNEIRIKDGTLTYRDGKTKQQTVFGLKEFSAKADSSESPLKISVDGDFNKASIKVEGTFGALAELQAPKKPFPVDIDIEAGGAKVKTIGTIADPKAAKGIDLSLTVQGNTLADLAAFAPGASIPALGPYNLAGHVTDKDGNINIDKMTATLGKTDLAGDVTLVKADKPTVRANLTSKVIDLTELQAAAAKMPAAPAAGGEKAKTEAKPEPAKPAAKANDGRVFSDAPLPLDGLKAANADVKLAAAKIVAQGPPLTNVNLALNLTNGKLTITQLAADAVGGHIDGTTVLDASGAQPTLSLNAKAKDLDLATLAAQSQFPYKISGKANFEGNVTGQGQSVRAIMAGLDGHTDLSLGPTHVDSTLLKIVMADLAKAVVGGGDAGTINCMVSRFNFVKGLGTSQTLVIDAESTNIQGSGTVNLASEQIDMRLDPSPKAAAVVDIAIPMKITGTLAAPNVAPDAAALAKKLGSSVTGVAGGLGGVAGAVTGGGGLGGTAGGLLGKLTGKKEEAPPPAAAAPAANAGSPCAGPAPAATPAKAAGPAAEQAQPPAAEKPAIPGMPALPGMPAAPASPASPGAPAKPASPVEDVGKALKGLFK
jgi:uncharacterized protein involved in outer membrane biogenesis